MLRFILFLLVIYNQSALANLVDNIDRQVLIQVSVPHSNLAYVQSLFPNQKISVSAATFQIWKVEFQTEIDLTRVKSLISQGKIIQFCRNRKLESRGTTPNDTFFNKQTFHLNEFNLGQNVTWGLNSISAWDFNKSATTVQGDTIVVAVCERGFDSIHQDLDYFINYNEKPNDGIDNDTNGAIDDYRGWNIVDNNGTLAGLDISHAAKVCGGIAAKGNNKFGVSGVAWNCKLMPINFGFNLSIDDAIKSYEYCIKMKRLYRTSNKKKGAYIVAINFSFGSTGQFLPSDEPLWGAAIDSLGNEGILMSVAVANDNVDAESNKDLPVLFNSDYQINVTNYNFTTLETDGSEFSKKYVHLAAPNKYWTTIPNNSYGNNGFGASYSAPLVAGAIALMYSNFDTKFLDTLNKNPKQIVKLIKQTILKQVDITDGLTNKVSSNGKLNLFKTIKTARTLQDSLFPRSSVSISESEDMESIVYSFDKKIAIKKSNHIPLFLSIYNMMGLEVMKKIIFENEVILDAEKLPDGLYIATYQIDNQFYSKKIALY